MELLRKGPLRKGLLRMELLRKGPLRMELLRMEPLRRKRPRAVPPVCVSGCS